MLDLSIVIVNWNAKSYLAKCLSSIEHNIHPLIAETLVIDNGSSDGSVETVRRLFPYVVLIENGKNLGFSKANNIGIRRSSGKYICLVNSDVVVLPGCFQELYSFLEHHRTAGMVGPIMLDAQGNIGRSTMAFPSLLNNVYRALALERLFHRSRRFGEFLITHVRTNKTQTVDVLNGFFWMIRRNAIEEVGLLDESFFIYGEDIDYCKRFHDLGWENVLVAEAKAIHFGGASSSKDPIRFYLEMQRANLRYWRKHVGRISELAYRAILAVYHFVRMLSFSVGYALRFSGATRVRIGMRRSRAAFLWLLFSRSRETTKRS